jgi:hypothetical protein
MKSADHIVDIECSYDTGRARGRENLLLEAEHWCNKPHESAAFSPEQNIKQGQVKTANELLEYLKK